MSQDVFERVGEIANNLSPDRWMLVGGLMVHPHAQLAGTQHWRPTDLTDLVVEARAVAMRMLPPFYCGRVTARTSP